MVHHTSDWSMDKMLWRINTPTPYDPLQHQHSSWSDSLRAIRSPPRKIQHRHQPPQTRRRPCGAPHDSRVRKTKCHEASSRSQYRSQSRRRWGGVDGRKASARALLKYVVWSNGCQTEELLLENMCPGKNLVVLLCRRVMNMVKRVMTRHQCWYQEGEEVVTSGTAMEGGWCRCRGLPAKVVVGGQWNRGWEWGTEKQKSVACIVWD